MQQPAQQVERHSRPPYWVEGMQLCDCCSLDFRTVRNMREIILPQLERSQMYTPAELAAARERFEARVAAKAAQS
jgi:hypothetical protein